jgi:hypothetical protein
MTNSKVEKLLCKRRGILKMIAITPSLIKASPVTLARSCGQPNCRCRKGRKHVSLYLSQSCKSRTKMTYIPHSYEKRVKECVENCRKLLKYISDLSEINLEIIRKRGRI